MLVVLVAVIPALGMMLYSAAEQRQRDAQGAQLDARRHAELAAADQDNLVDSARQLLLLLAQLPAVQSNDAPTCNTLLAQLLPAYAQYTNFTVVAPDGNVVCSAPSVTGTLNLADRAYFQRAVQARGFAAGDHIIGRITGKTTIDFAYAVQDAAGQIDRVLAVGLDLAYFSRYLIREGMAPGHESHRARPERNDRGAVPGTPSAGWGSRSARLLPIPC